MISIQQEPNFSLEDYVFILDDSGLGKRRPMNDPDYLARMLAGSNLLITAREDGRLLGFLRGLTDHCYRCFIADLAVAKDFQGMGIGKRLIEFSRNLQPEARLFLFSAEDAIPFYQKLGFSLHDRCYQLKPDENIL